MDYQKLIGTWKLNEFNVLDEKKEPKSWQGCCHGHLVYTPDGYVSACINRIADGIRKDSLYFAKVNINSNGFIEHHILESSQVERIGHTFIRFAQLENNCLILTGKGPSGDLKIVWQRC